MNRIYLVVESGLEFRYCHFCFVFLKRVTLQTAVQKSFKRNKNQQGLEFFVKMWHCGHQVPDPDPNPIFFEMLNLDLDSYSLMNNTGPQPLFPRILPKFHVLKNGPFVLHIGEIFLPVLRTRKVNIRQVIFAFLPKLSRQSGNNNFLFNPSLSVFLTYVYLSVYLDCDGGKALRYLECISVQPNSSKAAILSWTENRKFATFQTQLEDKNVSVLYTLSCSLGICKNNYLHKIGQEIYLILRQNVA
jgi:hypothetical protein